MLTYRHNIDTGDIDGDEGESIEVVEESGEGTVVMKKVNCGKNNCKCQSGELHGPCNYAVTRQGDSLNWDYKGPVPEEKSARLQTKPVTWLIFGFHGSSDAAIII